MSTVFITVLLYLSDVNIQKSLHHHTDKVCIHTYAATNSLELETKQNACWPLACQLSQVGFNSWYWLHCHSSLRVSSTIIENLRWQPSGEIIQVTFGKSSTLLVQQLKKKLVHKSCATGYWLPLSLFKFFLKFWTNDVEDFPKVTWIIFPPSCHLRFLIVVLETF